jgi:hypothetical protein
MSFGRSYPIVSKYKYWNEREPNQGNVVIDETLRRDRISSCLGVDWQDLPFEVSLLDKCCLTLTISVLKLNLIDY